MEAVADPVVLDSVTKSYGVRGARTVALDSVTLSFPGSSFTAVMGPSGSGKSTLLHCAAGLDRPTQGTVSLEGRSLEKLSERALARIRRERLGFVFQSYNLLPELSVADNVALPLRLAGGHPRRSTIRSALGLVGLEAKARTRPGQLSGGQQQRVAIARALLAEPSIVFADEPTGALDSANAGEVLQLLGELVARRHTSVIMVTHDPVAAAHADSVVFLADGRLVDRLLRPTAEQVADRMTRLTERRTATPAEASIPW